LIENQNSGLAHIPDDQIDRYAAGNLLAALEIPVEEHLLICSACQSKLVTADEFSKLFRLAVSEIGPTPATWWQRVFRRPALKWGGITALVSVSAALMVMPAGPSHSSEAVIAMQSLRGPGMGARILSGSRARLVFDMPAPAEVANACKVQIIDRLGKRVLETGTTRSDGQLTASIKSLKRGDYWARLYCGSDGGLTAEYSLTSQ
jgi:anti-sigma factor RsiW